MEEKFKVCIVLEYIPEDVKAFTKEVTKEELMVLSEVHNRYINLDVEYNTTIENLMNECEELEGKGSITRTPIKGPFDYIIIAGVVM